MSTTNIIQVCIATFLDNSTLQSAHTRQMLHTVYASLLGVKVSGNAAERRSRARKFKPGAFRLQNFWISQPEPMFLGPAS